MTGVQRWVAVAIGVIAVVVGRVSYLAVVQQDVLDRWPHARSRPPA